MPKNDETKKLINRLSRVQGQLDAIKRNLEEGDQTGCTENVHLLKASVTALKKFGEAYVSSHMEECIADGKAPEKMEEDMKEVIKSAFAL
jgi:DNA-binding FrmR family transcriptional regulator